VSVGDTSLQDASDHPGEKASVVASSDVSRAEPNDDTRSCEADTAVRTKTLDRARLSNLSLLAISTLSTRSWNDTEIEMPFPAGHAVRQSNAWTFHPDVTHWHATLSIRRGLTGCKAGPARPSVERLWKVIAQLWRKSDEVPGEWILSAQRPFGPMSTSALQQHATRHSHRAANVLAVGKLLTGLASWLESEAFLLGQSSSSEMGKQILENMIHTLDAVARAFEFVLNRAALVHPWKAQTPR
jgi:hypothetical protein